MDRPLGAGAAAVVWDAVDVATGRRVALKVLSGIGEATRAALRREVEALRRLRHPGVVRILDAGAEGETAWIVTELVEGETLRAVLDRRGRVDVGNTEWRLLFARLCEALAHVHGHGITHGDLKPENILLARGEWPVLVDFGFSTRLVDPAGRAVLRDAMGVAGTPIYMAPEQLAGRPPDARSDLWAAGVILHELLTGRPPARCADTDSWIVEPALAAAPDAALRDVVARLLAPDPRDRFAHAADVLLALGLASEAAAPPAPPLLRPNFTGRDAVLDRLITCVRHARGGEGALACLVGASGIGKTRLLDELVRIAAPRMRVVSAGARPLGGQRDGSGAGLPLLEALLDVLPPRESVATRPTAPDAGARERIARDLLERIETLAAQRPLAIVLDDLQWADELTLAWLEALPPGWLATRSILLVVATRADAPGAVRAVAERSDAIRLELGPLPLASSAALIADLLNLDRLPADIAAQLHGGASGNPLHLIELVRLGLDEGWLRRVAPGRLLAVGAAGELTPDRIDTLALPDSLAGLLMRRLGGFDARARGLLEAGAVLGRSFDDALICETAELEAGEGLELLVDLVARDALGADTSSGQLRFGHDALAEGIYATIAPERRRLLHGRAARALTARRATGGAPAPQHAVLAHHWELAGDGPRERDARGAAAQEALAQAAFEQARSHLARAIELDDALAQNSAAGVGALARASWQVDLARCGHALGDPDAMEREARAALRTLGVSLPRDERGWNARILRTALARLAPGGAARDPAERARRQLVARAADVLVHHFFYCDDVGAMVGSALIATRAAERAGTPAAAARSWMVLASLCGLLRLHDAAKRHFARGQEAAQREHDRSEQAYCLATRAVYHANFGDFASAREAVSLAEERLEGVDDPFQREIVVTMRGHVAHFTGHYSEASAAYEEVLASARRRGNLQREAWGLFSLARTALVQGRVGDALAWLESAAAVLREAPELQSEVICFGLLAYARLQSGDENGALAAARSASRCIERSRPSGFPAVSGYAALAASWSALARRRRDASIAAALAGHLRAFRRFSRFFPMARPSFEIAYARELAGRGAWRRARIRLERSRTRARALGMPYEEAQASLAIAALAPDASPSREQRAGEALALLARIGAAAPDGIKEEG